MLLRASLLALASATSGLLLGAEVTARSVAVSAETIMVLPLMFSIPGSIDQDIFISFLHYYILCVPFTVLFLFLARSASIRPQDMIIPTVAAVLSFLTSVGIVAAVEDAVLSPEDETRMLAALVLSALLLWPVISGQLTSGGLGRVLGDALIVLAAALSFAISTSAGYFLWQYALRVEDVPTNISTIFAAIAAVGYILTPVVLKRIALKGASGATAGLVISLRSRLICVGIIFVILFLFAQEKEVANADLSLWIIVFSVWQIPFFKGLLK